MSASATTTIDNFRYQLRSMTVDDLAVVMEIERRVQSHPWKQSHFRNCLQIGNLAVVAECETARLEVNNDHKIVAFAVLSCGGGEAELLNIAVAPEYQRRGLARWLLSWSIDVIKDQANTLFLEVRESNQAAIDFYNKMHFNRVGERRNYYPSNNLKLNGREHALILALDMGANV